MHHIAQEIAFVHISLDGELSLTRLQTFIKLAFIDTPILLEERPISMKERVFEVSIIN